MTDHAVRFYRHLQQHGVHLVAADGVLHVRARLDVLDDVVRTAIHIHCAALLVLTMLDEHACRIADYWVVGAALPGANFDNAITKAADDGDVDRLQAALIAYHDRAYTNCQEVGRCLHVTEPALLQWYRENPGSRCATCWVAGPDTVPEMHNRGSAPEKTPSTQPELPYTAGNAAPTQQTPTPTATDSKKETPNDATRTAVTAAGHEVTSSSTTPDNDKEKDMKRSEIFKSKYFKAADVDPPLTLTIQGIEQEMIGEGDEKRLAGVAAFKEDDRKLVLNLTNWDTLATAYGDESDDWAGHRVTLVSRRVSFKGKSTFGVRIEIPQARATGPTPAPAVIIHGDDEASDLSA